MRGRHEAGPQRGSLWKPLNTRLWRRGAGLSVDLRSSCYGRFGEGGWRSRAARGRHGHSARPSPPPAGRCSGLRGRRVVGAAAPTAAGFKAARSVASLGAGVQLPLPSGPLRTRRQTQRPQEVLRLCRAMGEFYMNHLIESSPAVDRDLKKSTDRCRSQGSEMGELG